MKNFKFKSAICTTKEQSEKLLALGLKKETADMKLIWLYCCRDEDYYQPMPNDFSTSNDDIPAWSLHRLVEIMFKGDIEGFVGYNIHANSVNIMYEYAISNIEALIKMGTFNKDYFEERK